MTALGKTVTVFVFLLSLIWSWLTINTFVTRANWKTQVDKYKSERDAAVSRAEEFRKFYETATEKYKETSIALTTEISREKTKAQTSEQNLADLKAQFEASKELEITQNGNSDLINKKLIAKQQEIDILKQSNDEKDKNLTDSKRAQQEARNDALRSSLELDATKKRNESLEISVLQLQGAIRDIQQGRTGLASGAVVPVPAGIRATISQINSDLVSISLGADAGILYGAVLDVSRGSKYLGKIKIQTTGPKEAVGKFEPANGLKAVGDNLPQIGDVISVINGN